MDSGPKRGFDRLLNEAVERRSLYPSQRKRLAGLWLVHRWKKSFIGFCQLFYVLSIVAVIIAGCMGFQALSESDGLHSLLERAGVWAGYATWAFACLVEAVVVVFSYVFRVAGWVLESVFFLVRGIFLFVFEVAAILFSLAGQAWEWIAYGASATYRFLHSTFGGVFAWIYGTLLSILGFLYWLASSVAGFLYDAAVAVFGFLYGVAASVAGFLYGVASTVFGFLYGVAASVAGFLYDVASTVFGFLYGVAASVAGFLYDVASAVFGFLYGCAASVARFFHSAAVFLYGCLVWTASWLYDLTLRAVRFITLWYWFSMASEWKVAALFLASMLADRIARLLAKSERYRNRVRFVDIIGAALFSWMLGHIIELFAVRQWWNGLEIASMGMWILLPLFVAVMTGVRPLLHEAVALAVLLLHLLAYTNGVSGNVIMAFDVSLAVAIISGADLLRERLGVHTAALRYASMGVLCFILYCGGFVWDLPAILEFRGYAETASLSRSVFALALALGVATLLALWAYWRKGRVRTRNDALFTLLLLLTLLFSFFPTGILLHVISIGTPYDLTGSGYNLSIFASNILLATLSGWVCWFLWCLWLLVESSDLNNGIMAQVAVTAMLGSLETRYIEIVRNISFSAGLVVLPLMLMLVLAEIRIIRLWLVKLRREPETISSVEG